MTVIAKPASAVRLGVFVPPALSSGASGAARRSGEGWLPPTTQARALSLLESLEDVELLLDLDFTRSYVKNGRVYTDRFCLSDLDVYFWSCEVDRRVGSYDLEVLKTLAQDVKVVMNPYNFDVGLDKYQAHARLRRAGVGVAETVLVDAHNIKRMQRVMSEWGSAVHAAATSAKA